MRLIGAIAIIALSGSLDAADYQPWQDARFENARVRDVAPQEIYPDGAPDLSSSLALSLIVFDKTNWTEARALRQLRRAAAIFEPCEIGFLGVRLARVRGPDGRHDLEFETKYEGSPMPADVVEWSALAPSSTPWPLVFFLGRMNGDRALARSYRRGDVSIEDLPKYPYMNTAWLAFRAHWQERKDDGYSSLAHELAHLLCECGHVEGDEPHLLDPHRNRLGSTVLPSHCELMRNSSLLQKNRPGSNSSNPTQVITK